MGDRIYFAPYSARKVLVYDINPWDPASDMAPAPEEEDSLLQVKVTADHHLVGGLRRATNAP